MGFLPIQGAPGICKSISDYAAGKPFAYQGGRFAQGRYTDGDHVRFVAGFPEKLAGWQAISGIAAVVGTPRVERTWRDGSGKPRLGIGTENHLYAYDGADLTDVSPLRTIAQGLLGTNPFATTSGSKTIAVADTGQTLKNGDWVNFTGATTFNGLTILGWYQVSVRSGTGYDITSLIAASGSGAGGGAAVEYGYPRTTLGTDPFATTSGSKTVTVTHTNHGATSNDYVTFAGATAVAGLTLNGEFRLTVVNSNTYTIQAASAANATTTGGGSAVSVIYVITIGQTVTTFPSVFGAGAFGAGPFGFSQNSTPTAAVGWTLDRYGSQLLAAPIGGTIYVYDPTAGGRAYPLLNAPTNVLAMLVTPERFVVALGTTSSAMQMAWADQSDYTDWTSTAVNTANSGRTLQGGTRFIAGISVRDGVSLALSDKAAFQLNYSGDNEVYASPEVSDNASVVSATAVAVLGEAAFWMSDSDFWTWDGTIQSLPSDDIRDYVFRNINKIYISKCWVGVLRAKREVWFNYVSSNSTEIDSYVIWHIDQQCWSIGSWATLIGSAPRTAWADADLFTQPLAADADGVLYQHEVGTDDNGQALNAYLTFSPVDVSNGDQNVDVFGFIPDFSRLAGTISLTINTRQYPQDTNTVSGPFSITATDTTPVLDFRSDGKMVGFELDSNAVGADFRFGVPRLDVQPAGARL